MTEWKRLSFCLTPREYGALRVHAAINGKPIFSLHKGAVAGDCFGGREGSYF